MADWLCTWYDGLAIKRFLLVLHFWGGEECPGGCPGLLWQSCSLGSAKEARKVCRELLVVSHAPSSPSQPSVAVLYKIVVGWLFEPMSILELQNFLGSYVLTDFVLVFSSVVWSLLQSRAFCVSLYRVRNCASQPHVSESSWKCLYCFNQFQTVFLSCEGEIYMLFWVCWPPRHSVTVYHGIAWPLNTLNSGIYGSRRINYFVSA